MPSRKKIVKKQTTKRTRKDIKFPVLSILFFLLVGIPLTVFVASNVQSVIQFAQNSPTVYGCLGVGEHDKSSCPTINLKAEASIKLHGSPITGQIVQYGDTATGFVTYTNIGDTPFDFLSMGIAARRSDNNTRLEFAPKHAPATLQPGESITLDATEYSFQKPVPGGNWQAFATLVDSTGQRLDDNKLFDFIVNAPVDVAVSGAPSGVPGPSIGQVQMSPGAPSAAPSGANGNPANPGDPKAGGPNGGQKPDGGGCGAPAAGQPQQPVAAPPQN